VWIGIPHIYLSVLKTREWQDMRMNSLYLLMVFEPETSAREFQYIYVGFEVHIGRGGEGRCRLGCGLFMVY